jgi:hypothetical protein
MSAFFSLPLVGRVDASAASIGVGLSKKTFGVRAFQPRHPHPTVPTLSRGRDEFITG